MLSRRVLRLAGGVLIVLLWLRFLATLPDVYPVRTNDFPAYWAAGKMVLEGAPEQIYSPKWKWYTNLPVVSVLLVPLALLEYETAWAVLWWISVGSFVLVFALLVYALARYFPPLDPIRVAVVALVFFSFAPVMRRCLSLGQTTPLMVLLFVIVYLLARAGRERWAGLVLGVICTIKIPPSCHGSPSVLPCRTPRNQARIAAMSTAGFAEPPRFRRKPRSSNTLRCGSTKTGKSSSKISRKRAAASGWPLPSPPSPASPSVAPPTCSSRPAVPRPSRRP